MLDDTFERLCVDKIEKEMVFYGFNPESITYAVFVYKYQNANFFKENNIDTICSNFIYSDISFVKLNELYQNESKNEFKEIIRQHKNWKSDAQLILEAIAKSKEND